MEGTKHQQKWVNSERDIAIALVQPALRLVVIEAWREDQGVSHLVFPVIALRSTVSRRWTRAYRQSEPRPCANLSEDEMGKSGWQVADQSCIDEALFVDDEGGIDSHVDPWDGRTNAKRRLVTCTWPECDDNERLKPFVEMLAATLPEER